METIQEAIQKTQQDKIKHIDLMQPVFAYIQSVLTLVKSGEYYHETEDPRFFEWNLKQTEYWSSSWRPDNEFVHIYDDFFNEMMIEYYKTEKCNRSTQIKHLKAFIKEEYKESGVECCWFNEVNATKYLNKFKYLTNILGTWPGRKQIERWNNLKD